MKKLFRISMPVIGLLLAGGMMITSCTKEGPTGPAGKDGADGQDANENCTQCHSDNTMLIARLAQWGASTHAIGGNFERNGTTCAVCHTHEGFMEYLETGDRVTAAAPNNPSSIGCRTCHKIHDTYTSADYGLTLTDPVELDITGVSIDMSKGNVCTGCHQPRVPDPLPTLGGGDVTITSPYWGMHYSTQTAMLANTGGYEVPGTLNYDPPAAGHKTVDDGCVHCHMATAYGVQAGGHTWNMTYAYHGHDAPNMDACTDCHTSATDFNINGVQDDIQLYTDSLKVLLIAEGVLDVANHVVPGTLTELQAGAVMNYNFVRSDGSTGVHNTKYAKAILLNTIDAVIAAK